MGTTTTNLSLYKPAAHESEWTALVNANFDAVDSMAPALAVERFVDYQNGSDLNDGLTKGRAYKTIQAAWDALKTYSQAHYTAASNTLNIGRLVLAPNYHDVGTGVNIDGRYIAEIVGGHGPLHYDAGTAVTRIVTSSSAADYLFKIEHTAVPSVGYGARFFDIEFYPVLATATSLTKYIWLSSIDHVHIERCAFYAGTATSNAVTALYITSYGDSSWHRIINNKCGHMQFIRCVGGLIDNSQPNGGNQNRNVYQNNVVFYSGTNPMIQLNGEWYEGSVSFNNLEGTATAVELGPRAGQRGSLFDHNVFIGNNGESGDAVNPFYSFLTHDNGVSGCNHNIIVGGNCSSGASFGTFADFSVGCGRNLVIGSYDYVGTSGYKNKIIDNSTKHDNMIINQEYGLTIRTESGTAPAISDTDYAQSSNPWNGTMAVTHNTTTSEDRLWVRVNGAWKSVALA